MNIGQFILGMLIYGFACGLLFSSFFIVGDNQKYAFINGKLLKSEKSFVEELKLSEEELESLQKYDEAYNDFKENFFIGSGLYSINPYTRELSQFTDPKVLYLEVDEDNNIKMTIEAVLERDNVDISERYGFKWE